MGSTDFADRTNERHRLDGTALEGVGGRGKQILQYIYGHEHHRRANTFVEEGQRKTREIKAQHEINAYASVLYTFIVMGLSASTQYN